MKKIKNKKPLKITIIVVVAVCLVVAGVIGIISKIPPKVMSLSELGMVTDDIILIADRGFSAYAPENTDDAFIEAGRAEFYGAKCDIQLTRDEVWIVNYDSSINRMTNGRGEIAQMSFGEIRQHKINNGYRLGSYDEPQMVDLEGFLIICEIYNLVPYIEIGENNYNCFEKIFDALDNYEGMREKAVIISSDKGTLLNLQKLDKSANLWYSTNGVTDDSISFCKENGFTLYFNGTDYAENGSNGIEKAQQAKVNLACWTDDVEMFKLLYDLGVRSFSTTRIKK